MLVKIQCDRFAKGFQSIDFHQGLNIVLGTASGSNALGKSTFLWIIDYAFGGEGYCLPDSDIKQYVKDHTICFTFLFDGVYHYFARNTAIPKEVVRRDKSGHLIEKMSLSDYRAFLSEHYHLNLPFEEITSHFFRIYGKENTYEKYPYLVKPREKDDKAIEFLLQLFGKENVLSAIRAAEDESGIKEDQWLKIKQKPRNFDKIEENEAVIASLRERLSKLLKQDDTSLSMLGLETSSFETVSKLKKELRALSHQRDELKSHRETVKNGNINFINTPVAEDFADLQEFFPSVNIRELEKIENFHKELHGILQREIDDEVAKLDPLIAACDKEIARLIEKLNTTGVASEITQRVLSQCVSVSKQIDKLTDENSELQREKEQQEQRLLTERRFEALIADRIATTDDVVRQINNKLKELNDTVTNGGENAPTITVSDNKEITFGTRGNTSEGTAFKSMVLYDLALLSCTPLPAVIHDGNVLQSISLDNFTKILALYSGSGKQVFIAVDKEGSEKTDEAVVLELSENHTLFGFSWGKSKA